MELNNYQYRAMETCMPSCDNISYMLLNLVGEVGEFASKVAKEIRKDTAYIGGGHSHLVFGWQTDEQLEHAVKVKTELRKEAGDILWQIAGLCHAMGWNLEDVAQENLDKLRDRAKRGVILGSGDNR
jgi:NTP pyrophosphatase (non-canonical NTP hydrolase)